MRMERFFILFNLLHWKRKIICCYENKREREKGRERERSDRKSEMGRCESKIVTKGEGRKQITA
jgi:hypothetical protein